jgi:hypothetical protein
MYMIHTLYPDVTLSPMSPPVPLNPLKPFNPSYPGLPGWPLRPFCCEGSPGGPYVCDIK